jgi:hypothetical protein
MRIEHLCDAGNHGIWMQPDHSTTCVPACPASYTIIPTPKAVFSHLNHQASALPFRAEPWTGSPDASFQPRVRGSCHCAAHPFRSGASPDRADQDRSHIESREIFPTNSWEIGIGPVKQLRVMTSWPRGLSSVYIIFLRQPLIRPS